jgi:hypothetical protein
MRWTLPSTVDSNQPLDVCKMDVVDYCPCQNIRLTAPDSLLTNQTPEFQHAQRVECKIFYKPRIWFHRLWL